jgi:hypothetical protein
MTPQDAARGSGRIFRRARAAFWLTAALAAGAPSSALASSLPSARVSVTPGSGHPRTTFVLSLRIPQTTGKFASLTRRDVLSVSGPRLGGCVSRVTVTLRAGRRGARRTVALSPSRLGGDWCAGEFRGRVVQYDVLRCSTGPAQVCPDFLLAPLTIAQFRFHVTPSPPARPAPADVPTFAGLLSATTMCSASAPDVLPRPSTYVLTWEPASDPVTPPSAIVYDIFLATSPGAEDYARPAWTTSPGATSFTTPGLARTGPVYFVVRARNDAGAEDDNTVERQGVSACDPVT